MSKSPYQLPQAKPARQVVPPAVQKATQKPVEPGNNTPSHKTEPTVQQETGVLREAASRLQSGLGQLQKPIDAMQDLGQKASEKVNDAVNRLNPFSAYQLQASANFANKINAATNLATSITGSAVLGGIVKPVTSALAVPAKLTQLGHEVAAIPTQLAGMAGQAVNTFTGAALSTAGAALGLGAGGAGATMCGKLAGALKSKINNMLSSVYQMERAVFAKLDSIKTEIISVIEKAEQKLAELEKAIIGGIEKEINAAMKALEGKLNDLLELIPKINIISWPLKKIEEKFRSILSKISTFVSAINNIKKEIADCASLINKGIALAMMVESMFGKGSSNDMGSSIDSLYSTNNIGNLGSANNYIRAKFPTFSPTYVKVVPSRSLPDETPSTGNPITSGKLKIKINNVPVELAITGTVSNVNKTTHKSTCKFKGTIKKIHGVIHEKKQLQGTTGTTTTDNKETGIKVGDVVTGTLTGNYNPNNLPPSTDEYWDNPNIDLGTSSSSMGNQFDDPTNPSITPPADYSGISHDLTSSYVETIYDPNNKRNLNINLTIEFVDGTCIVARTIYPPITITINPIVPTMQEQIYIQKESITMDTNYTRSEIQKIVNLVKEEAHNVALSYTLNQELEDDINNFVKSSRAIIHKILDTLYNFQKELNNEYQDILSTLGSRKPDPTALEVKKVLDNVQKLLDILNDLANDIEDIDKRLLDEIHKNISDNTKIMTDTFDDIQNDSHQTLNEITHDIDDIFNSLNTDSQYLDQQIPAVSDQVKDDSCQQPAYRISVQTEQ